MQPASVCSLRRAVDATWCCSLPVQVLTALELARQARIAANRAYLAGLGLGPNAVHTGTVPPLEPNDPVMLQVRKRSGGWETAQQAGLACCPPPARRPRCSCLIHLCRAQRAAPAAIIVGGACLQAARELAMQAAAEEARRQVRQLCSTCFVLCSGHATTPPPDVPRAACACCSWTVCGSAMRPRGGGGRGWSRSCWPR